MKINEESLENVLPAKSRNNKNGYRGVMEFISRRTGKATYRARIVVDGKQIVSRTFKTIEEAASAYIVMIQSYE